MDIPKAAEPIIEQTPKIELEQEVQAEQAPIEREEIVEEKVDFNFDLTYEETEEEETVIPRAGGIETPEPDEVKPFEGKIEEVPTEDNQASFNFELSPEDTSEKADEEKPSFAETISSIAEEVTLDESLPKEEKEVIIF